MVAPGQRTLAGRYELGHLMATGGMGQVWRAQDVLLGRPVAVKILRSEYTGDQTFVARFRAEAHHAARLAHRNIATVHDYGEVTPEEGGEHLAYLVMELVEGEPLSTRLARERRLTVAATLDLLDQTAAALAAAHAAGVVHRDVKPGNVLLGDDGVVKITDFGIAWSASDVPLTQTGQVVGTAHYLSPEQADGGKASPASDVYALGMIGYECLAGRRAFEGDNAVQIALRQITDVPAPLPADIPGPVRSLIGRALLKDPAERFLDGAAFREAIADVRAGRALPPPLPPLLPVEPNTMPLAPGLAPGGSGSAGPARAPATRRWRRPLAAVATLAAGAVLGIGALQFLGPAAGPATPSAADAAAGTATGGGARPTTVLIGLDAATYTGRPFGEVEAALAGLGLRVTLVPTESAGVGPGLVTAVDPLGALHVGDTVRVSYAVAPPASPTGAQPAPEVVLAPAAATAAAPPTATPPAASATRGGPADGSPAKPAGKGAGKGHGEGGGQGASGGDE